MGIVYVNQKLADYMQLDRDYMLHNTYGHIFSYKDVTLKELYVNVAYHGVPMETENTAALQRSISAIRHISLQEDTFMSC